MRGAVGRLRLLGGLVAHEITMRHAIVDVNVGQHLVAGQRLDLGVDHCTSFCEAAPARERKTRREGSKTVALVPGTCAEERGAAVGTGCRVSKRRRTRAVLGRVVLMESGAMR